MSIERRRFGRRVIEVPGIVHLGRGRSFPCTLRNISETGALIEVATNVLAPSHVLLQIPDKGVEVRCAVRRQTDNNMGLEFVSDIPEALRRMAQVEEPSARRVDPPAKPLDIAAPPRARDLRASLFKPAETPPSRTIASTRGRIIRGV